MNSIERGPIFLKIKGGWINPVAILSVETHRDNEAMISIRVTSFERPIPLGEQDSATVREYLESRTWLGRAREGQAMPADAQP
jgi:hypothetical protein